MVSATVVSSEKSASRPIARRELRNADMVKPSVVWNVLERS
jgi:hypothetical protein